MKTYLFTLLILLSCGNELWSQNKRSPYFLTQLSIGKGNQPDSRIKELSVSLMAGYQLNRYWGMGPSLTMLTGINTVGVATDRSMIGLGLQTYFRPFDRVALWVEGGHMLSYQEGIIDEGYGYRFQADPGFRPYLRTSGVVRLRKWLSLSIHLIQSGRESGVQDEFNYQVNPPVMIPIQQKETYQLRSVQLGLGFWVS